MSRPKLSHIACHEAGHSVVALLYPVLALEYVTIIPDGPSLGHAEILGALRETRTTAAAEARSWLAGPVAEMIAAGVRHLPSGCEEDFFDAMATCRRWGLDWMATVHETEALVTQHWPSVALVAGVLLDVRRLTCREVKMLLRA